MSAFSHLLSTTVPSGPVTCAVWCPTMDLLALGTVDGKLAVRRLNWQRLWVAEVSTTGGGGNASAPAGPACVAWRPDGRALAVPCQGGGLEVRAAEDGRILTTSAGRVKGEADSPPQPAVLALAWAVEAADRPPHPASLLAGAPPARECPCIPPAPVSEGAGGGGGGAAAPSPTSHHPRRAPTAAEPPRLDVLAAADASGRVTLYGPGLLALARLDVVVPPGGGGAPWAGVALSDDLSRLWTLSRHPAGSSAASARLRLSALDTGAIGDSAPELRRAAHCLGRLADAVADAGRGLGRAGGAWAAGAGAAAAGRVVAALARLQVDNGSPGVDASTPGAPGTPAGAAAELRRSMLSGGSASPCPGLAALLERPPWGEAGLKRAAREADAAAAAAGGALSATVEPALEAAAYWAGELACLASCERWAGALGVGAGGVAAVAALARDAAAAAVAARSAVAAGAAHGRALFVWLLLVAGSGGGGGSGRPAADASPAVAAAAAAALDALLADRAGAALRESCGAADAPAGPSTPEPGGEDGIPAAVWAGLGGRSLGSGGATTLAALAAALAAGVEGLAAAVSAALSPSIGAAAPPVDLGEVSLPGGAALEAVPGGVAVAWAAPGGRLCLARCESDRTSTTPALALPASPTAVALYRDGRLAILVDDRDGSGPCLALLAPPPPEEWVGGGESEGGDGGAAWAAVRRRGLGSGASGASASPTPIPLAVSGPRGVAVVLLEDSGGGGGSGGAGATRTAALFDLEEDEEDEDEREIEMV